MTFATSMLLVVALALPLTTAAQDNGHPDAAAIAIRLLDRLDAHDYVAAESTFGAQMAAALPADKLKAAWESLPAQAGAAKGRGTPVVVQHDDVRLVVIPLHFASAELLAKTSVAADGRVVGFLIQPAPPAAAPALDADAGFTEREVSVGHGEHALPGTLAMPKKTGRHGVAAIVLVHGSGPQDRDETLGPNRPFLDLARGLAARGIAVLRYDKRTKARPQDFASGNCDIDAETTDDAVAAVATLRVMSGIDPKRVFVLGHSQGGMLAPRIANRSKHVAGLVLLAAPARPMLDILIEQYIRLAVLDDGKTSDAEASAIATLKRQVAAIRSGGDIAITDTPMHQPAAYWRSTDAVDAVAEAKAAALPMLVLQGARDTQVVDADWQRWQGSFHGNPDVTFKLYPTLNHLGIAVEGEQGLGQYAIPGHVDPQLIADVADWIDAYRTIPAARRK